MAYVNLYNPASTAYIRRLVRFGSFTYVIGRIWVSSDQFYIAKLSLNGNMVWQKRFIFPNTVVGGWIWYKTHFTDIVEMESGELILLGSDQNNFLLIKLTEDGDLIWAKKYYDRSDAQVIFTNLTSRARLFKLNEKTLVLKITETHSQNGGVRRIDHKFLNIEPNDGELVSSKEIISQNPLLIIRDEEVRGDNLVLFGYRGGKAAILTIDPDLNITQSVGIAYNGDLGGFNYLHIYAASPIHNGRYSVIGSFYHYDPEQNMRSEEDGLEFTLNERDDSTPRSVLEHLIDFSEPLPNRFTRFFIAELEEDNGNVVNERLLDKDFTATYQTIHKNTSGVFFSISNRLFKLNSSLTSSDWVKTIRVQALSSTYLTVNKSIGNTFDAYSYQGSGGKFSVASTSFDYNSCKTEIIDDSVHLISQDFAIEDIEIVIKEYSPIEYDEPQIEPADFESSETEELCPSDDPQPDLEQSTITANPTSILANGISESQITVQLNDASGNPITTGGPYTVEILFSAGSMIIDTGNVDGNGQFTTQLRSSVVEETSFLQFQVDNYGLSPNTATVQFIAEGVSIEISKITAIQSPYLYIQASGSEGNDSTQGRHLRWAFRGVLGEKHLPKGNYASDYVNFNKPKDFVKIYKAAYRKKVIQLNLIQDSPEVVDNANRLWIYRIEGKEFYVYFRNTAKYDQVRSTVNPMTHPSQFIGHYGSELIEIENIKELFFAVTINFSTRIAPDRIFKVETLSVSTNDLVANKVVTNRKTISDDELDSPLKLLFENGRAVRWQISNASIHTLDFEFYSETILEINNTTGWVEMGSFALTLDQGTAFSRLEPSPGDVNGVWQRFNEEAFVRIENYQHKWGATPEPGDRNIKEVVEQYIQLSENASNPGAIENIPLENNPSDPEDYMEISNLDMLNFSANDYHIARMLGLGILDIDNSSTGIKWLYVAEYYTSADLEDGQGKREVHHLFMSLPTSISDFRLPVPIDLDNITPGVFLEEENGDPLSLTDEDGYAYDGMSRYVSLYSHELPEDDINAPFFVSNEEIDLSVITTPVYGGLKYRLNQGGWQKPELSNDPRYYNIVPQGDPFQETRFILIPEPLRPFYTHRQTANGTHRYRSYGINWFSRAKNSALELSIETLIKQKNPLVPPSNTNALLIRQESPLLLTSADEQARLNTIGVGDDKTLIRLTYDYHSAHELKNYNVPMDSPWTNSQLTDDNNANDPSVLFPDNEEIFADEVDIFFRNQVPNNITGKALTVSDHGTNEILSIITTGEYEIVSTGETLTPYIAPGTEANYVGGVFISGENQYIIHQVTQASQGPVFMVYKKEVSDSIVNGGGIPSNPPNGELEPPVLVTDGLFMAIENMQNTGSWGTPNPLNFKVKVGPGDWEIHREVIEIIDDDGEIQRMVEKTRGVWGEAQVMIDTGANQPGIYEIVFDSVTLDQHPQYNSNDISAEWYKGIVRIFTESAVSGAVPNKTRKILPVIGIGNLGSNNLTLLVQDPSFDPTDPNYDAIQTGSNIKVNFYPGYKVYLYENTPFGLNEQNILPAEGEGVHYSIFGFRSQDSAGGCDPISGSCLSKISVPCLMFAQELIEAEIPEQPEGPLYATRPDFFGRSTYTLRTKYQHKPYGILFYRSNDEAFLNALYEKDTIKEIREHLEALGGNNEEYLTNRWTNFLDFGELASDGDFKVYPPAGVSPDGYKFPNPDKQAFFDWANHVLGKLELPLITDTPGSLTVGDPKIINFVRGAIYNAFVSLTEMPIIYQYLHDDGDYQPIDKPQVIKDRNGNIIQPGGEGFEMAPMMKVIGKAPETDETLFTDFKLDGTSNNLYFYGAKELSTQMKMSDFSPFLGPIKLVNTNAPEAPEIKRIIPVLENTVLGISPKIQLEINAYPKVQSVKKLTIYRAYTMLDAQSVQTMQLVKVVDLEDEGILDEPVWTVSDNFNDLPEIPYGDGLFYRVTVSREVKYADSLGDTVVEYAPSQASKIVASLMVEANAPQSPVLKFLSTPPDANDEIHSVSLQWAKMAYNAKYHLYKMNSQGNWAEIHKFQTNDNDIVLPLADTDLQSDSLKLINDEGNTVYHHFKVLVENTAGMLSTEENILTVFNEDDWIEI